MVQQGGKGCCHHEFVDGEAVCHLQPCSAIHSAGPRYVGVPLFGGVLPISYGADSLTQLLKDFNPCLIKALKGGDGLRTSRAAASPFALSSSD